MDGSGELIGQADASAPDPLVGRDKELERVKNSQSPILLVVGDIGIGKSALLDAAQAAELGPYAPAPITLDQGPGSLQRAMLAGLAEATAAAVREHGRAAELAGLLATAARKLVEDKGIGVAKLIGSTLLSVVKSKVGADGVDLAADYFRELVETEDETLTKRIIAASDPYVADSLVAFAAEVLQFLGEGGAVVLAFDGGEQLHEDDRRLLADLAARLPDGLRLRVSFDTASLEQRGNAEELAAVSGVDSLALESLCVGAVREWLGQKGLDGAQAPRVLAETAGYPLFIETAISQELEGDEARALAPVDRFIKQTHVAWGKLDARPQSVARQLAVLESPLPERNLMDLCNLGPAEWSGAIEYLQRASILTTFVNGFPWFHPKRREVVLGHLRDSDRAALESAAEAALTESTGYVSQTGELERTPDIALLAVRTSEVSDAATMDAQQLSVMAALIELYEPSSGPLRADQVVLHARDIFGGTGDLVSAVAALVESGFATSTVTENGIVSLEPLLPDKTAQFVIQGRAAVELGRLPQPSLVSSVFAGVIRPRVMPFKNAAYGMGTESLLISAAKAARLQLLAGGPLPMRGSGHFAVIAADAHLRPVAATISFESAEDRDSAIDRLRGLELDFLGGRFGVREVVAHPAQAVAAARLLRVLERVSGKPMNGRQPDATAGLDQHMELRVRATEFAYEVSNDAERLAFDLPEPLSIHWHVDIREHGESLTCCEVVGGQAKSVRHADIPEVAWGDQFRNLRFAETFGLDRHERIRSFSGSFGRPLREDPVVETFRTLSKKPRRSHRNS